MVNSSETSQQEYSQVFSSSLLEVFECHKRQNSAIEHPISARSRPTPTNTLSMIEDSQTSRPSEADRSLQVADLVGRDYRSYLEMEEVN